MRFVEDKTTVHNLPHALTLNATRRTAVPRRALPGIALYRILPVSQRIDAQFRARRDFVVISVPATFGAYGILREDATSGAARPP